MQLVLSDAPILVIDFIVEALPHEYIFVDVLAANMILINHNLVLRNEMVRESLQMLQEKLLGALDPIILVIHLLHKVFDFVNRGRFLSLAHISFGFHIVDFIRIILRLRLLP